MKIADLFVALGVRGDGPAQKSLQGVKKTLGDISVSAFEMKAAILAAVYSLEKLTSNAAKRATDILLFSQATGMSTHVLQQLQGEARDANVDVEKTTSLLDSFQQQVIGMAYEGGEMAGPLAHIAGYVGGIDVSKLDDIGYLVDKISQYVKSSPESAETKRFFLGKIGAGDIDLFNLFLKLHEKWRTIKRDEMNEKELKNLYATQKASTALYESFKKFTEHLAARHGLGFVRDLQDSMDLIKKWYKDFEDMTKRFPKYGDKLKTTMELIASGLVAASGPIGKLSVAMGGIIMLMEEWQKHTRGEESFFDWFNPNPKDAKAMEDNKNMLKRLDMQKEKYEEDLYKKQHPTTGGTVIKLQHFIKDIYGIEHPDTATPKEKVVPAGKGTEYDYVAPSIKMPTGAPTKNQINNINFQSHNYGVEGAEDLAGSWKTELTQVHRKMWGSAQQA